MKGARPEMNDTGAQGGPPVDGTLDVRPELLEVGLEIDNYRATPVSFKDAALILSSSGRTRRLLAPA